MQFSIGKIALLRELNLLQGVVEKKNTIPILSTVLLETVNQSTISLVATDLDVSLETECEADVIKPGSVVLQAKKIFDIVRNLPDADIHFTKEETDRVRVSCGTSEFKIVGQAKEHFPSTPKADGAGLVIQANLLHNLISRTIYAITQEESRYALNGALIFLTDNLLQMVSTDGHRLALAANPVETAPDGGEVRVITPRKALNELLKITAGSEESLSFRKDENHLFFSLGHRQLTSRMLAGQFPNYELVIPKTNDKQVTLNSEKLAQAIRRVALMADERSHGIKFSVNRGALDLSSQSADVGEARESMEINYSGEDVSIGFNAQYLLDFLNVVGTEEIIFEFKDDQSPALMRPPEGESLTYNYVVMPMRLS